MIRLFVLGALALLLAACAPVTPASSAPTATSTPQPASLPASPAEATPTPKRVAHPPLPSPVCCRSEPLATPITMTVQLDRPEGHGIMPPAGGEHVHEGTLAGPQTGADSGTAGVSGQPTAFDAAFIDAMIEHHRGAIAMANELLQESERPELVALAEAIVGAQEAEIGTMTEWRAAWYPALPAQQSSDMEMGSMGMGNMPVSSDPSLPYEQRFLTAMIAHHEGAIAMAQAALVQAEHPELRELAASIVSSQEAEIAQMRAWLAEWFGQ